ncbi:MAG: radical SAM protein [Actinomycetota bacterium]|nr:radical SAM protein [Actinomycetota bacterium]
MTSHGAVDAPPLVFGPVPSRRLGRSIGINNIPPKVCSFACVYCQVGPTVERALDIRAFYEPPRVAAEVAAHVNRVRGRGEDIDYLTFVPDGEPTLDAGLGEIIRLIRPLDIEIAVITNGSLLWRDDVREALKSADWVSVKVDAAIEWVWRRVNRPHPDLAFHTMRDGIVRFAESFDGDLMSETMLIAGFNDDLESIEAIGLFLRDTGFTKAYLSIPTRPTPSATITAPDEGTVNRAYHVLAGHVRRVEYLVGYEGDEFASSGDPRQDLLSVIAVHPMRSSAVRELLDRAGAGWDVVEDLIADGGLIETTYRGDTFFVRRFAPVRRRATNGD